MSIIYILSISHLCTNTYPFKITHLSKTIKKPLDLLGAAIFNPSTSTGVLNSDVSPEFDDDEKDLEDLQNSLLMSATHSGNLDTKPKPPNRNTIKIKHDIDHNQSRTISQKPEENKKPDMIDLIDFSDTDCMDVPNLG